MVVLLQAAVTVACHQCPNLRLVVLVLVVLLLLVTHRLPGVQGLGFHLAQEVLRLQLGHSPPEVRRLRPGVHFR